MGKEFVIEQVAHPGEPWADLEALFLELHRYHEPWQDRRLRNDWAGRWREFVEPGPDSLIQLARYEGQPIAYLSAQIRHDYGLFDEMVGFLNEIFVQSDYRSIGIGSALLARCEEWCGDRGAMQLDLTVLSGNQNGIDFWTRSGFATVSHRMSKPLEVAR
jgi:GNAT superfamily N-acetyltransferase